MNQIQKAKWERTRAKGKWRFVLLRGIIGFGVVMIVITGLMDHLLAYFHITSDISLKYFWQDLLTIRAPFLLLGGVVIGLIAWRRKESEYQEALKIAS